MNTFKVYIKDVEWKEVKAIFPFLCGELLDERLDEAQITFFSKVKVYLPLTEVKILFIDNGREEYFIIANDNSAEYPAGSGRYKHQTYILERTKLMEGVICPSITFTNSTGTNYLLLST